MGRVIEIISKDLATFKEVHGRQADFIYLSSKVWLELKGEILTFGNEEHNDNFIGVDVRQDKSLTGTNGLIGCKAPFITKSFIAKKVWWWK